MDRIPIVDHLILDESPHLRAQECQACGARFFDRRNACAACGGQAFVGADISTTGALQTFTIVAFAAEGVPVPYVAGIVDCDGTSVTGTVVGTPPDPEHIKIGMLLRLTTFSLGVDAAGVEAIGYGFEPAN